MVDFLVHRPIGVCITFLAFIFIGVISFDELPVSLLPDVPIPVVTVQAENEDLAVQEMENIITSRLRRYLMQCYSLTDIQSVTRDGRSVITLRFDYGINTSVAAIDVNEKIDRAMGSLPHGTQRPRVYKASATDIPVFYLNLKYDNPTGGNNMVVLSEYAVNVVRRRLEQLKEVAMVDITGITAPTITIRPREHKVRPAGLEPHHFENAFNKNNIELGAITVNEGHYTFSVRLTNKQWGIEELRLLPMKVGERIFTMGELAEINLDEAERRGAFLSENQASVSLAIIKRSDAKIDDLKSSLNQTIQQLREENPLISINITRDQIALLDQSLSGLKQSLMIGAILAFLVVFAFLSDLRLPVIIGLIIPVSVIISFFFFRLFGISMNIISISGIILAVGMMIDNSIIVIDNITQYRERGENTSSATILATNEVIRPLLSSALTTCAVFIPLVFISGMAGALFLEQAVTVSIGLGVSFWISITLLPTLYLLFFSNKKGAKSMKIFKREELIPLEGFYKRSLNYIFSKKKLLLVGALLSMLASIPLFRSIDKESLPSISHHEAKIKIEWNENINLDTKLERTKKLCDTIFKANTLADAWVGSQQYVLVRDFSDGPNVSHIWLKAGNRTDLLTAIGNARDYLRTKYQRANFTQSANTNLFEKTFLSNAPGFELRVFSRGDITNNLAYIREISDSIEAITGLTPVNQLKENDLVLLRFDAVKLSLYGISPSHLINTLWSKLKTHHIGYYNVFNQQIPVVISEESKTLDQILGYETIQDERRRNIPIKAFLQAEKTNIPYELKGGADGVYFSLQYVPCDNNFRETENAIREVMINHFPGQKFLFRGQVYDNEALINQMLVVLLVSILLLYFILAAQFESLTQPLIVLLELPIGIAGALLLLKLTGNSLNIMSAIGLIVTTGIIINDSILKIDTINRLRRNEGMGLMDAIHEGGIRRLRPIIMTTMTTILALGPVFFGHTMGVELQQPLALAIIGGLGIGTLVSLYVIPVFYWFIYRKTEKK